MIEIRNNFRSTYRSAVRKSRAEKIRVVRLEPDLIYVSRRNPGHGQYLVRFFHEGETVSAVCETIFNEVCRGTYKKRCCVHIAAAYEKAVRHGQLLTRREQAA